MLSGACLLRRYDQSFDGDGSSGAVLIFLKNQDLYLLMAVVKGIEFKNDRICISFCHNSAENKVYNIITKVKESQSQKLTNKVRL